MAEPRDLLEEYVVAGKALQPATLCGDSAPVVCNRWYARAFSATSGAVISGAQHPSSSWKPAPA